MPSHADTVDSDATTDDRTAVPSVVRTAARRYWRRTLSLRVLVALVYFSVSVAIILTLPYLPALAVIIVLLGTLAAPLFDTGGTIELTTDRSPAAVREDFTSATPPVVGFQAALADEIRATETGAEYDLSTAFGLRSATMAVETKRFEDDADADVEIIVTVGDKPWGRYTVKTHERGGDTAVTITMRPDRRFGVRRLPDFVFGRRYRRQLFDGQGYTLVADDTSLSVRS